VAVLFESPRRLETFLTEARAGRPERIAAAELVAVPEEVLRPLARVEERRVKLGLTLADDHLYLDLGKETLDGALVRGRP
jgi:hypothetical protein